MVKRGDINFTMSHIPPKNCVCCIFQMQHHKPNGLWTPKEHNNILFHCIKAVSQLNVYHFNNDELIMIIMKNNANKQMIE